MGMYCSQVQNYFITMFSHMNFLDGAKIKHFANHCKFQYNISELTQSNIKVIDGNDNFDNFYILHFSHGVK